jgi:hypothetical protein
MNKHINIKLIVIFGGDIIRFLAVTEVVSSFFLSGFIQKVYSHCLEQVAFVADGMASFARTQ